MNLLDNTGDIVTLGVNTDDFGLVSWIDSVVVTLAGRLRGASGLNSLSSNATLEELEELAPSVKSIRD